MKWTPFTAHISVTPIQGKRFVHIRSLQKLAVEFYDALSQENDLNISAPGGGQYDSTTGFNNSAMSQMAFGSAIKPQFGDYPAQLMITGFYHSSSENLTTNDEINIFSANQGNLGSLFAPHVNVPKSYINSEVKTLKTLLDSVIASPNLPLYANAKVHRLDYSGIIFGNRGFHFPI